MVYLNRKIYDIYGQNLWELNKHERDEIGKHIIKSDRKAGDEWENLGLDDPRWWGGFRTLTPLKAPRVIWLESVKIFTDINLSAPRDQ